MEWSKLLSNKCPKCNKELDYISDKDMMMCTISCGFMITTLRMKEICSSKSSYRIERDNKAELNNLGSVDNSLQDETDML